MSTTIPKINECTPFSVTKSAEDPALLLASKKKKYVVLGVFFSGVGLAGLSAAQYSSSSGDGSGGIRASINIDGSLSSVDLRSGSNNGMDTCVPATGTWNGKSFDDYGPTSFETCYKDSRTGKECWSNSYLSNYDVNPWLECRPQGYTWNSNDEGWHFLNSGAASTTCGSPCQKFECHSCK